MTIMSDTDQSGVNAAHANTATGPTKKDKLAIAIAFAIVLSPFFGPDILRLVDYLWS